MGDEAAAALCDGVAVVELLLEDEDVVLVGVVEDEELVVVAGAKTDVINDSATENIDPSISVCACVNCAAKRTRSRCCKAITILYRSEFRGSNSLR